jgi:predicted MFS family arabinose efflux permease
VAPLRESVAVDVDEKPTVMVAGSRWLVLAAYCLLAACTQLLWLTFAPVDTLAARAMGVDVGLIGDLAGIFPLIYVVLALPTGRWLDGRYAQALGVGALLTGAGAVLRLGAPTSFAWQLTGQLVIAAGQPLVLNAITKLAARNFPPRERAAAISMGSVALFIGILAAVLVGGPLYAAGGLRLLLLVEAIPGIAGAVLMLVALRLPATFPDDPAATVSLRWLARDRMMWLLAGLIFVGMGTYNAIATWLQPILEHFGSGGDAGNLIALMTVGGIVGAAFLPSYAAARNQRRTLLLAAVAVSTLAFAAIAIRHDTWWLAAWLFIDGVVLMACLPVVLDWSEVHSGPERAGSAAGFLLMAGNLGGVVLVAIDQVLIGNPVLAFAALGVVSLVAIPLAWRLPGPGDRPATA